MAAPKAIRALRVKKVGNSWALILPAAMLRHLDLKESQKVFACEVRNGYFLTGLDPAQLRQIELGRTFMDRYEAAFVRLAK